MTNICTKVTVRKRPIKNGQVSLYLDNSFCPLKTDRSLFSHKLNSFFTSHVFNVKSENKHVKQTFF